MQSSGACQAMNTKASEFKFIEGMTVELSSKNLVFSTSVKATMKIKRALEMPDISNPQLARIISAEPVLSAQVLKLANTAMFNRTNKKFMSFLPLLYRWDLRWYVMWLFQLA